MNRLDADKRLDDDNEHRRLDRLDKGVEALLVRLERRLHTS